VVSSYIDSYLALELTEYPTLILGYSNSRSFHQL